MHLNSLNSWSKNGLIFDPNQLGKLLQAEYFVSQAKPKKLVTGDW